ncbi:leucine-rich repeat neuronal protein 1-like [Bradysia coprophila]|uniref:leucine-rich repeat neuronal protein 1-like n=1 Tax=Bradysia coprophila TaxID=38358 RepID=UPI00187DA7AB|nr:leucine-rich repeat neuronal protein 1-like [Bradysia coprophila]
MARTILFIAVLTFAINCKIINAIALHCRFETVQDIYICSATTLIETQTNQDVTGVFGAHQSGKGNADVHALTVFSQNLQFFPTNIEGFFPNLEFINFYNNSIPSVSNRNLTPFPNLWYLGLTKNRISALDRNLFSGLNTLREVFLNDNDIISIDSNLLAGLNAATLIDLSNNRIRHVGHDLILPEKGVIRLLNNSCVNTSIPVDNVEAVKDFIFDLLLNCPPTISLIESTLESRPNFIQDLMDRIAVLERIIESDALKANG